MVYYAVMYQGKCVAKIVWDGVNSYYCPYLYDELVEDPENKIPVHNGDHPVIGTESDAA